MTTSNSFRLDGVEYDMQAMAPEARAVAARLAFVQQRLQELQNQQALLNKARNAYIADLKTELLRSASSAGSSTAAGLGTGGVGAFLRDDDSDTF